MKNRPAAVERIIPKPRSDHSVPVDTTGGEEEEEQEFWNLDEGQICPYSDFHAKG
jgi:hypothetical protein